MAIVVHTDHISDLAAQERNGVVQRLLRRVRVTGITTNSYSALATALTNVGIAAGSTLSGFPNLVLAERNPKIAEGDPGTFDVDLIYEHINGAIQSLDVPPLGLVIGEARAVVTQVETNLDQNDEPIVLEHRYPGEEAGVDAEGNSLADPDYPGKRKFQGGTISYMRGESTLTFKGVRTTSFPWLIERYIVGNVNGNAWQGAGPREWMCTACAWRPIDGFNDRYEFTIEFQHNPDTWDPTAVFIDDRTGKPPADLVQGTGYKTIPKHIGVDFEQALGARIQGS